MNVSIVMFYHYVWGGCFKLPIENGKINGRCIQKELFPIKFPNAIFQGVKDPIAHST